MKKHMHLKQFIITAVFLLGFMLLGTSVHAQPNTYTVQPGDTLFKISTQFQITLDELRSANPQITDPNQIYVGQSLSVPSLDDIKAWEHEVGRLVNVERSKKGLQLLTFNWDLSKYARLKSQDMADKNYFSHTSPTYGSPFRMMESFGFRYSSAGENIAAGQRTPQEVMTAWMNSPGHRANILSPSYTQIGVGLAKNERGRIYWTQWFMKPLSR